MTLKARVIPCLDVKGGRTCAARNRAAVRTRKLATEAAREFAS